MENHPKFLREFSKTNSSEERNETAGAIKAKRSEFFSNQKAHEGEKKNLEESANKTQESLNEQLVKISDLEKEIEKISGSKFKELLNYFKLKKLKADTVVGEKTYEELKQQLDIHTTEIEKINKKLTEFETPPAFKESEKILDGFYKNEKTKWAESEYSKEDITKYFSEEHLSSLSMDDYVLLMKRFPSEMVTHVTRQGVRDHVGMMYHTAGENEYLAGFMDMVEDGRLRSPLGIHLKEEQQEKAIAKYLHLDEMSSKQEAEERLYELVGVGSELNSGGYADKMAVHFATEEVADGLYGSEKGNEIFVAYPSAYIASQYYFSGQLNDGSGGYWNDQWVWANEERGMGLNAGLVFIPEEARVDRKTGSRYELDENKNPKKNLEYISSIKMVVDSDDFYDFANQAIKISGQFGPDTEKLEPFREKLEAEFGISDVRLQSAILDYSNLDNFVRQKKNKEEGKKDPFHSLDSVIEGALQDNGILLLEAKDPISSKEYWEDYFAKNPNKKPSKIIYYKGGDPTKALFDWRKKQGLEKNQRIKAWDFQREILRKI